MHERFDKLYEEVNTFRHEIKMKMEELKWAELKI